MLRSGCVARGDIFINNGYRGTVGTRPALSTSGARFHSIFVAALREWPSHPISQMWNGGSKDNVSCPRPRS